LYKRKSSFVHFVLDPVVDSSTKASFAVRYGCLVQIESVQKLEIGALISIRGVCRVNISNLLDMEPYFRGTVSPLMDDPYEGIEIGTKISKLRESMCNLHSLQMKLKVPEDEPLQTNIRASLLWSEKEIFEEYNESFIPGLPERLSFAAYQTVSGDVSLPFQPCISKYSGLVILIKLLLFVYMFSEKCKSSIQRPTKEMMHTYINRH